MDRLSRFIKSAMLRYPDLFSTRLSVLSHAYLVLGNGIDWKNTNDGAILSNSDCNSCDEMSYTDLDHRDNGEAPWDELLDIMPALYRTKFIEKTKIKRAEREERAKNIDQIASTPDLISIIEIGHYEEAENILSYIKGGYLPLGERPPHVESSFRAGAIEILDAVIRSTPDDNKFKESLAEYRNSL
jgi:hypothetical protein